MRANHWSDRLRPSPSLGLGLCVALSVGALPGCLADDTLDPGPTTMWAVGDAGTWVQLRVDGQVLARPPLTTADLRAIACHGPSSAWVVGDQGTVLRTRDGGETWTALELDVVADWRAVAVAEDSPDAGEVVWIAGPGGAWVRSPDGGETWTTIATPVADFSGLAAKPDGSVALAVAEDGSLWIADDLGALERYQAEAPLRAIAWAAEAEVAVAVGDGGIVVRDAGQGWQPSTIPSPNGADLLAVAITDDGETIVAAGDQGTLLRIESFGFVSTLRPVPALRGVVLGDDGRGHAVGDAGTILIAESFRGTWEDRSLTDTQGLRAIASCGR